MPRIARLILSLALAGLAAASLAWIAFASYVRLTQFDGELPSSFGNWKRVQEMVPAIDPLRAFTFAAAGDTRSDLTFEVILEQLKREDLSFLVLLGDITRNPTEADRRFLRTKIGRRWNLKCPVFYLPGNHDLDPEEYPLEKFEAAYGEARFSFTRGKNRFIFLSMLPSPHDNAASLRFLEGELGEARGSGERAFVFGHCSPHVSEFVGGRALLGEGELVRLLADYGAAYYLGGDFHGYCRTAWGPTTYIATGGGGAHLVHKGPLGFHHATIVTIAGEKVVERLCYVPKQTNPIERLTYFTVFALARAGWLTIVLPAAVLAAVLVLVVAALGFRKGWRRLSVTGP